MAAMVLVVGSACGSSTDTSDDAEPPVGSQTDSGEPDSRSAADPVLRPDGPGAFEVGHESFVAVDDERDGRSIPVDVWYPVDPGDAGDLPLTNLPLGPGIGLESERSVDGAAVSDGPELNLVIFSHGYQGINTQSVELMETLASHGFVVAAPEHTGNAQASPSDTFDDAAARRVPDVTFLIDTMLERSADPTDAFAGRLDGEQVGVAGHSFGAMTALGSVAGWAGADPDPRVASVVAISGVIDAELQSDTRSGPNAGFTAEQLAGIDIPVLLMGGTEDVDVLIANNEIAFGQLSSAPEVYKVDIIGANHTHFANVCVFGELLSGLGLEPDQWASVGAADLVEPYAATCGPEAFSIAEAIRLQNLYVVAFFQATLRGVEGYEEFLTEAYSESEPAADVEVA